jgi:hypothetical protein
MPKCFLPYWEEHFAEKEEFCERYLHLPGKREFAI